MILDRLETLSAISFIEPAISKKPETGRNCLFIRVDDDRLILTGGSEFVVKKAILFREATTEESARTGKKKSLPETFMIPIADLLAFKEMMKQHKADCKKLAKNDQSFLFVEIDDKELISYDGKVVYDQPKFEFKNLEPIFEIKRSPVSNIPVMSGDISAAVSGFRKSQEIEITFTGDRNPIHFEQGDYESILIPPVEKKKDDSGEQLEIED